MATARTFGQRAQTAIELAVFGAILIFALGAIVRGAVGRGNIQNIMYRATRMALTMSYQVSETMTVASRNTASVLIVEDRLSASSGKYGAIDRAPMVMSGSATHSANLFMPVDFGNTEDLPIFDLFVNGQHIPLSTSAFKTIEILPDASGTCGSECATWLWVENPVMENVDRSTLPPAGVGGSYIQTCAPCPASVPGCVGNRTVGPCANNAAQCAAGVCADCSNTSLETYVIENALPPQECAALYAIADNHPADPAWCNGTTVACPVDCAVSAVPGCNIPVDERFDLDRNDLDQNGIDSSVPPGERERLSWQWYRVMGFKEDDATPPPSNLQAPPGGAVYNGLLIGEGISVEDSKNVIVDVDEDLHMETVRGIYHRSNVIIGFDVSDNQDGDYDLTFSPDRYPDEIPPGFTQDVNVYTRIEGAGTYLRIEEGNLVNASGQAIRTTSKKDTVDVVERVFKLSNDTGRLCRGGNPATYVDYAGNTRQIVSACGQCFTGARIEATCFDPPTNLLFIRSLVTGYQGHRWTTERGTDPYVEFLDNEL